MKISQLIVAAGIATASLVTLGSVADAAPTAETVCAEGALTTVIDDSGVPRQACVASAATDPGPAAPANPVTQAPVAPAPVSRALVSGAQVSGAQVSGAQSSLSQAVPTTGPAQLPRTGAGTGGLIIAAILVGTGSVASLLSRRKPGRP